MLNFTLYPILTLLIGFIIIFAYISFFWWYKYNKKRDEYLELADKENLFTKKTSVMRKDELVLFNILINNFVDKYYIFPQMSLANILEVKEEIKDHDNLYREINHRSLDFVFFDKVNLAPQLVIELNGKSHWLNFRKNRDLLIEDILKKANIKFLALQKTDNNQYSDVIKNISSLLS